MQVLRVSIRNIDEDGSNLGQLTELYIGAPTEHAKMGLSLNPGMCLVMEMGPGEEFKGESKNKR